MGIRAAAKAAVIGGYRSAAAVRRAIVPSSSPSSSTAAAAADSRPKSTFAVIDDWVIPEREVFGPVPTHEEAMAATIDLRDAFEIAKVETHVAHFDISKTHLSPIDLDAPKVAEDTALSDLVHPETPRDFVHSETCKHQDKYEDLPVASGASGRVMQAFTMLQESPEAQEVVASLASDKNIWEAVMNNEEVLKFYQTCRTKFSESSSVTEDEVEDSDTESSQSSSELLPDAGEAFKDYVEKMKAFVTEMVTNLSSIMQDLVATSDEGKSKGRLKTMIMSTKNHFANAPSSFVLLAIASILVILLKRA